MAIALCAVHAYGGGDGSNVSCGKGLMKMAKLQVKKRPNVGMMAHCGERAKVRAVLAQFGGDMSDDDEWVVWHA